MKQVIRGRRYDTETAKEIGFDSYNGSRRDFHWWSETLYQKRTGEFFLHGEGGAASRYSVSAGQNSWSGGERIIPLSLDEAREWAEKHMDADDYEEVFGIIEETDEKKTICLSLPLDVIEIIKRESSEKGISASAYIANIVRGA